MPGMYPGDDASGAVVELFVLMSEHRSHLRCSSQKTFSLLRCEICHVKRTDPLPYQLSLVARRSKSGS